MNRVNSCSGSEPWQLQRHKYRHNVVVLLSLLFWWNPFLLSGGGVEDYINNCSVCPLHLRSLDLTVESYAVVMLLTFILIIISMPSPTYSFIPGLKPSFSANPSHRSLHFLLHAGLTTGIPRTVYRYFWAYPFFLLLSFSVFHLLIVGSVR